MSNIFGLVPKAGLLTITEKLGNGAGYVTLETTQTITGLKTFNVDAIFNYNLYTANLIASNQIQAISVTANHFYPTTSLIFPDGSSQITAYKSLTPGTYSTCTIVVDNQGGISQITSGSANTADTLYLSSPAPSQNYSVVFAPSAPNGYKSCYQDYGSLTYNTSTKVLSSQDASFISGYIGNFSCSYVKSPLLSTTTLSLVGSQAMTLSSAQCPTMSGYPTVSSLDSSQKIATTQWVQGVISEINSVPTCLVIYNTVNAPFQYTITAPIPQTVLLKNGFASQSYTVTLPESTSATLGFRIAIRKTYAGPPYPDGNMYVGNPWNVSLNITNAGFFVDYNKLLPIIPTFGFNSNYVYVDMISDGVYWCINNLV
jgi:hypothetical protein